MPAWDECRHDTIYLLRIMLSFKKATSRCRNDLSIADNRCTYGIHDFEGRATHKSLQAEDVAHDVNWCPDDKLIRLKIRF